MEGEVDVEHEDNERANEGEEAAGEEEFNDEDDVRLQQRTDEQADDEQSGEQGGTGGESDGETQQFRPAVDDGDLLVEGALFVGRSGRGFLGQDTGAVDGATEAVRHGEQEEADAGNQDDRADGDLEVRDDID